MNNITDSTNRDVQQDIPFYLKVSPDTIERILNKFYKEGTLATIINEAERACNADHKMSLELAAYNIWIKTFKEYGLATWVETFVLTLHYRYIDLFGVSQQELYQSITPTIYEMVRQYQENNKYDDYAMFLHFNHLTKMLHVEIMKLHVVRTLTVEELVKTVEEEISLVNKDADDWEELEYQRILGAISKLRIDISNPRGVKTWAEFFIIELTHRYKQERNEKLIGVLVSTYQEVTSYTDREMYEYRYILEGQVLDLLDVVDKQAKYLRLVTPYNKKEAHKLEIDKTDKRQKISFCFTIDGSEVLLSLSPNRDGTPVLSELNLEFWRISGNNLPMEKIRKMIMPVVFAEIKKYQELTRCPDSALFAHAEELSNILSAVTERAIAGFSTNTNQGGC